MLLAELFEFSRVFERMLLTSVHDRPAVQDFKFAHSGAELLVSFGLLGLMQEHTADFLLKETGIFETSIFLINLVIVTWASCTNFFQLTSCFFSNSHLMDFHCVVMESANPTQDSSYC